MSKTQLLEPGIAEMLTQQNLLPIYILEDKLKDNFRKTNTFMQYSRQNHRTFKEGIQKLEDTQNNMRTNFDDKLKEMEKKIVQQISLQLDGRIAIAIGKSIESFTTKLQKKEKQMDNIGAQFDRKLVAMKKSLTYEITQENQKYFMKETKKLEDKLKNISAHQNINLPKIKSKDVEAEGEDWQAQHHLLQQLDNRIQRLEEFSVNIQKRFYNSMTSLKQNWKELGTELLQNKKTLNKKFDDMKADFIRLKHMKQFSGGPENIEQQFRRKLAEKFTDIYQLLGTTLTKNQYDSSMERFTLRVARHDDQFLEIRKQLAQNNQFFTFYANNANQDDLKQAIVDLSASLANRKQQVNERLLNLTQQNSKRIRQTQIIQKSLNQTKDYVNKKADEIHQVEQRVSVFDFRIKNLQDFNKFGPDKLEKIHNSLEVNFTADEQDLIEHKAKKSNEKVQQEFKVEFSKLKDQLFIVNSQNHVREQELKEIKKKYQTLEDKIAKLKFDNQEAMVSRKPWVCLSCDKQEKEKESHKKQSKKRLEPFKGFGPQKGSEKSIKLITPPYEQRFEVYQKFRQKYLSDTVKLPEIYKEKFQKGKNEKQSSFQN